MDISIIILNLVFSAIFIGIFYFTYVISIEKNVITDQAVYIAHNISSNLIFLPDSIIIPTSETVLSSDQITNNKMLENTTMNFLIFIYICGLVLFGNFVTNENFNITIIRSLLSLIAFGFTEFIFLKLVISNYITADPNYVFYKLITNIQNQLQ